MKKIMILVLLGIAVSCTKPLRPESPTLINSGWSIPVNGLQFQITTDSQFSRNAQFNVTCTVTNSGTVTVDVVLLARLCLVDRSGVTNYCERHDDIIDAPIPLETIAPGQATAWGQDGYATGAPGAYTLFAVWDGNKEVQSPSVQIRIR